MDVFHILMARAQLYDMSDNVLVAHSSLSIHQQKDEEEVKRNAAMMAFGVYVRR